MYAQSDKSPSHLGICLFKLTPNQAQFILQDFEVQTMVLPRIQVWSSGM
jgi:hypothetical protein